MENVQLSHRMYSISDIIRLLENQEIVIQPKYQRRRTNWPITAKTSLMDTLLNNFPIQPIYLREYVTPERLKRKEIIDGQQRISTIIEYISDEYELGKNFSDSTLHGYKYSELPFEIQQEINYYELSFISIKGATDSDIISIFSRLNSFTLPLNAQEKRNALWSGQFKTLVYKLSSLYSAFWSDFKIFSDKSIARMGEAQFISEVLATLDKGFDRYSKKTIDELYKNYDEKFVNFTNYYESFNIMMSIIGNLLENNTINGHFKKQSWFFTLFIALFEMTYFSPGSDKKSFSYNEQDLANIEQVLIQFVHDYNHGRVAEEFILLYRQGTNSASNRKSRHDHFLSLF